MITVVGAGLFLLGVGAGVLINLSSPATDQAQIERDVAKQLLEQERQRSAYFESELYYYKAVLFPTTEVGRYE